MGNIDDGMVNVEEIDEPIKVGNGNKARALKKGSLPLMLLQRNGDTMDIVLDDYKYSPQLGVCLFSLTKAIEKGWSISNQALDIILTKGNTRIMFDKVTRTKDGVLFGVDLLPRVGEQANVGEDEAAKTTAGKEEKKYDGYWEVNKFHKIFGHASVDAMRATAKHYNWKLTGTFEACEDCQMSNAQQRDVPKSTSDKKSRPGERLFIDSSSVTEHASLGGATVWLAATDDATGFTWSHLLAAKSDIPEKMLALLRKLNDRGHTVKYIRCDDAGENKSLKQKCQEANEKFLRDVEFEFTARSTPQLNGKVERKIATITRQIRATLNAAKLPAELRKILWGEAVMYCTDISNCLQSRSYNVPAYVGFFQQQLPCLKNMRQFGEIAYVKFGMNIKAKLKDRGVPMMYLGRAVNHSADTYRLMNLESKKIINSRDATWLNKVYGEWKQLELPTMPETIVVLPVDGSDTLSDKKDLTSKPSEKPAEPGKQPGDFNYMRPTSVTNTEKNYMRPSEPQQPDGRQRATAQVDKAQRALRELAKLQGTFNPDASTLAERIRATGSIDETADTQSGGETSTSPQDHDAGGETATPAFTLIDRFGGEVEDFAEIGLSAEDLDPSEYKTKLEAPKKFKDAWDHPDPFQRKQWREAIDLEFRKMDERGVWRKINRAEMEEGRRCVKHKWVFDIKRSGRFRARLVACGYSQIPGTDFNQIFAPVANDVSFRILIILMLLQELDYLIFDVETAFLQGDLQERIYMDCPEGMEHHEGECLLLQKTIYGLVQSAREYNRKFVSVLTRYGFKQCPSDPCLFMRQDEEGVCYVLTYVDDNLVIGKRKAIDKLLAQIRASELSITVEEGLDDYLSCEVQIDRSKKTAWIGQPHMVKKIVRTFEEETKGLQTYKTPGTPGFGIVSPKEGEAVLDADKQSRYRTGVGMLMYLIKHSRPDISNAVRELTKVLGKATTAAYKEMLRCAKFIKDTASKGLRVEPKLAAEGKWELVVYSDSDWAGCKDDRRSVGSFIIFLCGVPVMWRSKSQKVVSLSSSEAEFYACAEAVKEVPFIAQILLFMGIQIELPVQVWIDNVGAIFMSENVSSSTRTRHMDTRWWYVNQLQEQGMVKVNFVPTKDNVSDIGTKNVQAVDYERHEKRLISSRATGIDSK